MAGTLRNYMFGKSPEQSTPSDQLLDIDCHQLVLIFDAFYFQSRFTKRI